MRLCGGRVTMNNTERNTSDQHTITDWPIEIKNVNDIPKDYQKKVLIALKDNIFDYVVIFAPACLMVKESFDYLFAYGNNKIYYYYKEYDVVKQIIVKRYNVFEVIIPSLEVSTIFFRPINYINFNNTPILSAFFIIFCFLFYFL